MSVRNLAAAGLVSFAIGGPLLLLGALAEGRALVFVGAAGLWAGLLLMFAAVLQLGRIEHKLLRAQGEAARTILQRLDDLTRAPSSEAVPAALTDRLTAVEASVDRRLDAHHRELMQILDARVLGIHETVRDLTDGRSS